jgi:phosphate transport system substrate-binding protein
MFLLLISSLLLSSCSPVEKQITVVIRESGSGTREAFDRSVTNGIHFLEGYAENGKKISRNAPDAVVQTKSGALLSLVANDPNAIGYLSLASVNDHVKLLSINGVLPTQETVASGLYPISRPFVIMTTKNTALSPLAADFLRYLKSDASEAHARAAGATFLADPTLRSNPNAEPIPVSNYQKQATMPDGKIVIRGSTSLERLIISAVRSYAALYGVDPSSRFDIQLEGSAIGLKSVENDTQGNVIGLSSADVSSVGVESFRVALDAIAVIVHPENTALSDLSLTTLYDIFSGKIRRFSDVGGAT